MKQLRQSGSGGYTAIELMIVLFIAAILATLAAPSFTAMVQSARLDTYGQLLQADLLIARREAIRMNGRVLVCPVATSGTGCGTDYSSWSGGWLVCYDVDANGACDATSATAPNPIVLRGPIDGTVALAGPSSAVRFNSNGTQGSGGGSVAFTIRGKWSGSTSMIDTIAASGNIVLPKGS